MADPDSTIGKALKKTIIIIFLQVARIRKLLKQLAASPIRDKVVIA